MPGKAKERSGGPRCCGRVFSFFLAAGLLAAPVLPAAAASPVFQAAGTAASGIGAVTPAWPAHQIDDVALLFVEAAGGQPVTLTTANGFVEVANSPQATGLAAAGTRLAVYWCRATSASMAAPVVADPGDHAYAIILTFRGVIKSGDPWDVTSGGVKAAASVSVSAPGVTTTVPDTLLVAGVTKDLDAAAAFASAWANAGLAGIAERSDAGTNSGGGGGIAVVTGTRAVAGATGNTSATVTSSINAFLTIALKPLTPPYTAGLASVQARQISAAWNLVGGATGYTLAASPSAANPPADIYASSETLVDTGAAVLVPALSPNTTYYLFVRSNGPRQSSWWNVYPGTATLLAYPPLGDGFAGVGADAMQYNWTANGNADPGTRYRAVSSASEDFSAAVSSYTYNLYWNRTGLNPNTTYYFKVAGVNHNNVETAYTEAGATATLLAYPPAAAGFPAVTSGGIQFNWGLNGNPPGLRYLAESSDDPAFANAVSSYTYNLYLSSAGLGPNTTYYFRVAALNHNGVPTAYAQASTATLLAYPPVFGGFTGVGSGALQFNWTENGNAYPGTLYRVASSSSANFSSPVYAYTYDLYFSSAGLAADTTYYFRVAGVNHNWVATGEASGSTATLLAFPPAPDAFGAVAAGGIQFRWAANGNADPGTLYHAQSSAYQDFSQAASSYTYNTTLSSAGLAANTTYYFRVAGVNRNGVATAYTDTASTSTLLAAAPVFDGFPEVTRNTVRFGWSGGVNPPGTLYRVYSSREPDFSVAETSDTYNTYLSSSGLSANTTCYFKAAGINNNGVATAYTGDASTSTLAAQPSGPYFTGTAITSMQLNWDPEDNGPGVLYRVLSSTAADVFNPGSSAFSSSDTYNAFLSTAGLIPETDYRFAVAAVNNNGVRTGYTAAGPERTLAVGQIGAPVPGAVSVHVSSISAAWSVVAGATGYTLVASLSDDPAAAPVSSTTAGGALASAYVFDPALSPDTVYYLFVRANGFMASSAWTAFPAAATRLAFPPAFSGFSGVTRENIRCAWTANGNADPGTRYRVLSSTAPDPLSPDGAVVLSSDTYNLHLDAGALDANTTYYFRAAGLNKDGVPTGFIPVQSTSTLAATPLFDGFSDVASAALRFNWSPDGNAPGTLYRVLVSSAPDPYVPGLAAATSSDTYNTYLSSAGLTADTTYYFRAAAINNNGVRSEYSLAEGTATRLAFPPLADGFSEVGESGMRFKWTANNNADGTLYLVLASTAADLFNPDGAVVVSSYTYGLSLSASGLAANTTYYFRAAGVNKSGVPTAYTAPSATATLANIPLTAASTFSAVALDGFNAAWEGNANPAGTLYTVRVSTAQDFNSGVTDQATASTAPAYGLSYDFSGLGLSTVYYFQVRAVNHNGVATAYAPLGSTRTLALPAPVPGSVTAAGNDYLSADWQLVGGATGYTLAASLAPGNPPVVYASSTTLGNSADEASVLNPALAANTTYYLFVRANGPGESSLWAAFPPASTLANAPVTAASTFSAVGFNGFAVSWGGNSNPLGTTLYDVQVSSAADFNSGATDQVAFSTAPAAGPGAEFAGLNADTYYYFRVRARHNGGGVTAWVSLGFTKTKAPPVIHAAGDGVLLYGQAGNAAPQFRNYYSAANNFSAVGNTVQGVPGSLFVIKTSPLDSKQEAVAGYVKSGVLHVLCTDGANWYEEWTQAVGGNETTRRFDVAYETNTGDVMVLYSRNAASTDELGYRTRPGASDCGSGGWSADIPLDPARTSGVVQWVKLASDPRVSSGTIAAVWADANSDLSAMVWNGAGWENEPSDVTETSLEVVAAAQDVEDFDVEFEALSGDLMVVWANSAGANGTNGVRYRTAAWTGAAPLHTWGAVTTPPTFADDATNLDLAANPNSNEMVFASIGNAGSDLQVGYWSGSVWVGSANADTAAQAPLAGTKLVAAGWLTSGGVTRSVIAYNDSGATNIGWLVGNNGVFAAQTDAAPAPAFAAPQKIYDLKQDPLNKDRAILTVSDVNSDLFAKRVVMTAAPAFTWTDAGGGASLETNLSSAAVGGHSFFFWPAPPVTTLEQSASRFFANTDTADVGAPLAAQDTRSPLPAAGAAFRLRVLVHVGNVQLPVSGQAFKLQFAGRGAGACEAPSGGVPDAYTDVTAATLIAFNDNSPVDGAALAANAGDPRHGAHVNVSQTYEELNNASNSLAAIGRDQDGQWDFSLRDNGMSAGTGYCLRLVKDDGSELNGYGVYPEVFLPAAVYINEVYPSGAAAADDWVELYNNTASTVSLVGWKLYYVENTIDLGGTPNLLWTGSFGQLVNALSTFTIAGPPLNLNGGLSYHVRLEDNGAVLVDQVQWPVLSSGQSFARITDGEPAFFEIDPTPTKNYANAVATDTFKINEVSNGAANGQFVELYNVSAASTRTLAGYALRSSAGASGGVFRFTRRIYPQNYAVLDFSSVSDEGKTFAQVFGAQGFAASGDFLTLENSTGSAVDSVTWQADNNYSRYNYKAELVPFSGFAPGNAANSIARRPSEGAETGNDSADFTASTAATAGSRNNSAGYAAANTLYSPADTQAPQFLSRNFPLTLAFGAASAGGAANNIIFTRTGGSADQRSPHLYRLQDIGFNPASLAVQTTAQTGLAFNDQDGYPLVSSASYRVTLNTDAGAVSAPQIILGAVTYDGSVHAVAAGTVAPVRMNNASRAAVVRMEVSNNSPAGFNAVEAATVTFRLLDPDLAATLDTQEARNLFNAVMLVKDSLDAGTYGIYEPGVDLSTVAYVPMAGISLDPTGLSTLTVSAQYLAEAAVPAASTRTFYVVFESTQDASARAPNIFRVKFSPVSAVLRDAAGGLAQDFSAGAQVDTSSVTLIAPAGPPAGTVWPYALPAAAVAQTPAVYYTLYGEAVVSSAVYISASDGYLRAVKKDGSLKWSYPTSPLSPLRTIPNVREELVGVSTSVYIYFGSDNGDLYKVRDDGVSAGLVWKQPLGVAVSSGIIDVDTDSRFYFGASDNKIYCLNKADGSNCGAGWPFAVPARVSGLMALDTRATVNTGWVGLEDGQMISLRIGFIDSPTAYGTGAAIKSSPLLDARFADPNNVIYFTSTSGKLYARVSSNLTGVPAGWADYTASVGTQIRTSPFMTFTGTKYIYYGDDAGRLHKVEAATGLGAAGWPFQAGGAIRSSPVWVPHAAVPQGGADYVYFGCDDGYLYALDAVTGAHRNGWPVAAGGPIRSDIVVDTDAGTVIAESGDGKTYVVKIAE